MGVDASRYERGGTWDRAASASGIAFAILAFIAFLLTGRPEERASGAEVVEFFADKESAVEWQALLFGLSAIAFLWFAARLAELIRLAAFWGGDRLAFLTLGGAAASTALFLAGAAAFAGLAQGDDGSASVFHAGDFALGLSTFTAAAFVAGASGGILRSALAEDWLGWLGAAVAALLVLNGIIRTLVGGDAGATFGTVSFVAFLAWVLLLSALLTLRHAAYAAADERAPARTTTP